MVSQWYQAIVTAVLVTVLPVTDQGLSEPVDQIGVTVGDMVGQVMKKYLIGCHLVLMTTTQHSPVFSSILRLAIDILFNPIYPHFIQNIKRWISSEGQYPISLVGLDKQI